MIELSFEQKQKILLMLLVQIQNKAIYSELETLILSASNIDALNYLREIINTQISIENHKNVKESDIKRVVLLANQKTSYIDKISEMLLFSEIIKALNIDKKKIISKPKP